MVCNMEIGLRLVKVVGRRGISPEMVYGGSGVFTGLRGVQYPTG